MLVDLIQSLFDPVSYDARNESEEKRTYMMFARFLTEAEGTLLHLTDYIQCMLILNRCQG